LEEAMPRTRHHLSQPLFVASLALVALVTLLLPSRAAAQSDSVLFVLDTSRSMNWVVGRDNVEGTPSRLDIARSKLLERLATMPSYSPSGLIQFPTAGYACGLHERVDPASGRPTQVVAHVRSIGRGDGSTPLAMAIDHAGRLASQRRGRTKVVVLTDGDERCGGDPVAVASAWRSRGIDIELHVIGFAVGSRARSQLQSLAAAAGGTYYDARDAQALDRALEQSVSNPFRELGRAIGGMIEAGILLDQQRRANESRRRRR
jgi:Ca-activated chloride channel homolog